MQLHLLSRCSLSMLILYSPILNPTSIFPKLVQIAPSYSPYNGPSVDTRGRLWPSGFRCVSRERKMHFVKYDVSRNIHPWSRKMVIEIAMVIGTISEKYTRKRMKSEFVFIVRLNVRLAIQNSLRICSLDYEGRTSQKGIYFVIWGWEVGLLSKQLYWKHQINISREWMS